MSHDATDDPLKLVELFVGGGEPWLPLLKPALERQRDAADFIGPQRAQSIVPVRELTFQALKPNAPGKWNVVIFGQNPYPRVESATGIAMFDNAFGAWGDAQFGKVTSIRCIIKAACMWKHGIEKSTSTADIRALLKQHDVVTPPQWFQAMLTQGVLLLNAALTACTDDSVSTSRHTSFWKPVVERIVEAILAEKHAQGGGVVFGWWGNHAKALRSLVDKMAPKFPKAKIEHVDHCNPAAMGDAFCNRNHFGDINKALASLGLPEVDWLPTSQWHESADVDDAARMGDFIQKTQELHKLYLERLQSVGDEKTEEMLAITGILAMPPPTLEDAVAPLGSLVPPMLVKHARALAEKLEGKIALSRDEVGAVYLYTTESGLYRKMNAALRDNDRSKAAPYRTYLRLFLAALDKLERRGEPLWRGVPLDLRAQYPAGRVITWWGVSSCTSKLQVARGFLGAKGRRTLFEVRPSNAVSIRALSAFQGEEELVLAPGTQLKVVDVETDATGLCTVRLEEQPLDRLVS